jgi:hypothetical protein
MDEVTWRTTDDALAMLAHLFPGDSLGSVEPQQRQSRLYLIACARRSWDRLPGVCREMVKLAEQVYGTRVPPDRDVRARSYLLAESLVHCRGDAVDLRKIARDLIDQAHASPDELRDVSDIPPEQWMGFAHLAFYPFDNILPHFRHIPADIHSADLVRELFGNPFRRLEPMRPEWRTDAVRALSKGIDVDQDYQTMLLLADALQDAGCDQIEVLEHFRSGSGHARGCWALEWVLTPPQRRLF